MYKMRLSERLLRFAIDNPDVEDVETILDMTRDALKLEESVSSMAPDRSLELLTDMVSDAVAVNDWVPADRESLKQHGICWASFTRAWSYLKGQGRIP